MLLASRRGKKGEEMFPPASGRGFVEWRDDEGESNVEDMRWNRAYQSDRPTCMDGFARTDCEFGGGVKDRLMRGLGNGACVG